MELNFLPYIYNTHHIYIKKILKSACIHCPLVPTHSIKLWVSKCFKRECPQVSNHIPSLSSLLFTNQDHLQTFNKTYKFYNTTQSTAQKLN